VYRWLTTSGVHTKIEAQGIAMMTKAHKAEWAKALKQGKPAHPIRFRSARKSLTETLILEKGSTGGPAVRFLPVPYVLKNRRALCIVKIGGKNFEEAGDQALHNKQKNQKENPCKKRERYFLLEDREETIQRLLTEGTPRFECKIKWDKRVGSFHLIYLYELPKLVDPDPTFQNKRIVATDPGVYPFQAWYSPTSAEYGRLLEGDTDKLMQRCIALDKRQSWLDRFQGGRTRRKRQRYRTRKRFRRRLARERNRLRGWVQAAHYNCANLLLKKHDLVLQPLLETARLSRRATRRIQKDTVRKMLTWSHSLFVQRLESKAGCYPGRHVIHCKEPGTSKTCTHCGHWKANLRVSDKRFVCPRCHLVVDRQLAGARNNFFAAYGAAVGVGWDGVDG
jgi:putative transposase